MSAAAPDDALADLVARCVVAFEASGDEAVDELLSGAGALADAARRQLQSLRDAGLLVAPRRPERIGRYRVRKLLGHGGMGAVWLCEQDEPIRRRVAVKLIRAGLHQGEILRRFHLEQQALALLSHPAIARVLDAGATDDGAPFLVMEYVPGLPIARYCDDRQLPLRARLELFLQVCDAVQHAHQKGILHRDLKSTNVLVTDRDGAAFPVVIDFGVAKSVAGPLGGGTAITLPGRLLGTPEYMSPEQASNEEDVDTRADVFSLGVMLYELLTGTLPIASADLALTRDVARTLLEAEPPTPSTRLTKLGDDARRIAENRRSDVQALARTLRGDLDWIVLKAIERDRNRRYGMVGELAADVRRYLADEPVLAARPGRWYVASKFCRRYRLQVGAAAAVFVALATGFAFTLVFHREAAAAASRLHGNLGTTLAAVDRIVALGADGLQALPQSGPLRAQLLEQALELHERLIADGDEQDPRLRASLASALARAANLKFLLGRGDASLRMLQRAEQVLHDAASAGDEPATALRCQLARAWYLCGELRFLRGEPEAGAVLTTTALAIYDAVLAHAPSEREALVGRLLALRALSDRSTATDVAKAHALLREAMPLANRFANEAGASSEERLASLRVWVRLAWLECELGQRDEALALSRRAQAWLQRALALVDADAGERIEYARLATSLMPTQVRLLEHDAARTTALATVAELRRATTANPELVAYRGDLANALHTLALLQGDREPLAAIDAMRREALQLEDDAYERGSRSGDRGSRYVNSLLEYVAESLDWQRERADAPPLDLAFLRSRLARAEVVHGALSPALRDDRHTREAWTRSFLCRAGILLAAGDREAAGRELARAAEFTAALQRDHAGVLQAHRIAAEIAFERVQLASGAGERAAAWQLALQGLGELQQARGNDLHGEAHWKRARAHLLVAAALLTDTEPPPEASAERLAAFAADYAGCLSVARSDQERQRLRAFGARLLAIARERGLAAARADAVEFAPLR